MAQGLFSQGTASTARPTQPSTVTTSTSATTTDVTVSFVPSVYGPVATSYVVIGTHVDARTSTATTTGTSVLLQNQAGGRAYVYTVRPQNANGVSTRVQTSQAVTTPVVYGLAMNATATTSYTIPLGTTQLGAIVLGGGATGGNGENGISSSTSGAGGAGGGAAGAVVFEQHAVTSGNVLSITVGAAGGTSSIAIGGTTIAQATGGNGTTGGIGTSNATTKTTANGANGGAGGARTSGSSGRAGTAGSAGAVTSLTIASTITPGLVPVEIALHGGGGGGGGVVSSPNDWASIGNGGAAGGTGAGAGGRGGFVQAGQGQSSALAGGAGTILGAGGGGGGGGFWSNEGYGVSGTGAAGGAGFAGNVRIYIA